MHAGKPLEPEGPMRVVDIYRDRCHLLWEPPTDDGGLPIDYYLVELQDVAAGGRKWTEIGRVQEDTQCGIPNLEPGKKYKFRVSACNVEGQSDPLATEKEILAKDPWGQCVMLDSFIHGIQFGIFELIIGLPLQLRVRNCFLDSWYFTWLFGFVRVGWSQLHHFLTACR